MDFWISVASAVSGMAGTVLIYCYGVPKLIDNGGAVHMVYSGDEGIDEPEKAKIEQFKFLGNLGLGLIFVAFLLQLLGLLLAR